MERKKKDEEKKLLTNSIEVEIQVHLCQFQRNSQALFRFSQKHTVITITLPIHTSSLSLRSAITGWWCFMSEIDIFSTDIEKKEKKKLLN